MSQRTASPVVRHVLSWRGALAAGALLALSLWQLPLPGAAGLAPVATTPLADHGAFPILLPPAVRIVCEGDSLTYGAQSDGPRPPINGAGSHRAETGWPEALERALPGLSVENRGFPGDTVALGARRWQGYPPGALAILMFGTNDAGVRPWKRPAASAEAFQQRLARLIARHRAAGAQVLVLAPPPPGTRFAEQRLRPYRRAARDAALATGAHFLDPARFLPKRGDVLQRDGLHLTSAANAAIARGISAHIRVSARVSPQNP